MSITLPLLMVATSGTSLPEAHIFAADQHCNHKAGLCKPRISIRDHGWITPPRPVRWMYGYWVECWQEVRLHTEGMRRVWHNVGDWADLDYKRRNATRYWTMDENGALQIVIETAEIGLSTVDALHVYKGTPAHVGPNAKLEELIANDLGTQLIGDKVEPTGFVIPCRDTGSMAKWDEQGSIAGLKVDIAHFTTMGGLFHTEMNAANKLASEAITFYAAQKLTPPDQVIRAHVHRTADSADNYSTRAIILPCWQLQPSYIKQKGKRRYPDIGMILQIIDNGKVIDEYKWIKRYSNQQTNRIWTRRL